MTYEIDREALKANLDKKTVNILQYIYSKKELSTGEYLFMACFQDYCLKNGILKPKLTPENISEFQTIIDGLEKIKSISGLGDKEKN